MRKKICVILSVCVMVIVLAACGSSNKPASTNVSNGKEEVADGNISANTDTNTTANPEQVTDDSIINQTVDEYIATQNKAPKYYLFNPIYKCLDELGDYNKHSIFENNIVVVYFGEERIPSPNDKVLIVSTSFDETIEQKSLEEVIKNVNNCYIKEIINTPVNLEVLINPSYKPETKEPVIYKSSEPKSPLRIGNILKTCVDLSDYYGFLTLMENTNEDVYVISHAIPFVVYDIDSEGNIYNASNKDEFSLVYPKVLTGKANSVMIVKMKDVETYDILLRVSNEDLTNCNFYDVPYYKVIANNLTEKEVEKIVLPGGVLNPDYNYLIDYKWNPNEEQEAVGKTLFEYLLKTNNIPRYFIYDYYYKKLEELNGSNRVSLSEDPTVYVYFGQYTYPQKKEKLFIVDAHFEKELVKIPFLEDIIDSIKNSKIVSVEVAENFDFIQ